MVELAFTVLYAVVQLVVEAESGMIYPEARARASVPLVVIGLPPIVKPVGTVISTEVTVPAFVVVPTTCPKLLTERTVLERPVKARLVVVAFVVVEFPNV